MFEARQADLLAFFDASEIFWSLFDPGPGPATSASSCNPSAILVTSVADAEIAMWQGVEVAQVRLGLANVIRQRASL